MCWWPVHVPCHCVRPKDKLQRLMLSPSTIWALGIDHRLSIRLEGECFYLLSHHSAPQWNMGRKIKPSGCKRLMARYADTHLWSQLLGKEKLITNSSPVCSVQQKPISKHNEKWKGLGGVVRSPGSVLSIGSYDLWNHVSDSLIRLLCSETIVTGSCHHTLQHFIVPLSVF